ncbi:bestrophin-like domain [Streptomyces pactum]|uniref:bestrophin-like domain n=1 Tax=Streptomyces pactum TaxID=68249 RepID=UPI0037035C5D
MSEWMVLLIAMAAACAVVLAITVLKERRVGEDYDPSETPDVIEYMTMMVGVVYAIVLGLAIAGVWEARGAAQDGVRLEAQALFEVSERAGAYPALVRDRIRADVRAYVDHVVETEWRVMIDKGELTDRGDELLRELRREVTRQLPPGEVAAQTYQPLVDRVAAVADARGAREQSAGPTMPGVVWFGLVLGAVLTVGLIFTLQIRRSARELMLAGLFSMLIAFLLFLVWDFDAPFGRSVGDTTGPFTDLFPT